MISLLTERQPFLKKPGSLGPLGQATPLASVGLLSEFVTSSVGHESLPSASAAGATGRPARDS